MLYHCENPLIIWVDRYWYYFKRKYYAIQVIGRQKTCDYRRATKGGRGDLPCPFLKIKKKCSDFRKKGPDCVLPYVKFSIQNVVLRVSKRKRFKIFPCGAFFSGIFYEMFIGEPKFHETSPALKNFLLRAWTIVSNILHQSCSPGALGFSK